MLVQYGHARRRPTADPARPQGAYVLGFERYAITSRREEQVMLVTTTPSIEGYEIVEYLGLVTGEAILGANIFKDFFAGIRDIVGGRSAAYEQELRKARELAVQEMTAEAERQGANAVVAVDLDYETLQVGQTGGMLMVSVSGTAVRVAW
jgi:uncharacterized protein YbjQ (UPF0145 family)